MFFCFHFQVFCNSIFEGASYAPNILLKLMYHWACQTNVHNIISWVKVDNLYIKNFFTNLRAVCTAAVCEKFGKMGGPNKKVEVSIQFFLIFLSLTCTSFTEKINFSGGRHQFRYDFAKRKREAG